MDKILTGLLLIVGLINFLPAVGVLAPGRMQAIYDVDLSDPNLLILMRHRALLFGLIGGLILIAAFYPLLQPAAMVLGLLSMIGFVLMAFQVGGYNAGMVNVIKADLIGSVLMLLAAGLYLYSR